MKSNDIIKSLLNTIEMMNVMNHLDVYGDQSSTTRPIHKDKPITYSCMCGKCTSKDQARNKYICPECDFPVTEIDPEVGYAIETEYKVLDDKESLGEEENG